MSGSASMPLPAPGGEGKPESRPTVTRLSLGCLILVRSLIQPFAKSYSLYRSKTNHAFLSWFHGASHLSQVPWREVEGHYSPSRTFHFCHMSRSISVSSLVHQDTLFLSLIDFFDHMLMCSFWGGASWLDFFCVVLLTSTDTTQRSPDVDHGHGAVTCEWGAACDRNLSEKGPWRRWGLSEEIIFVFESLCHKPSIWSG